MVLQLLPATVLGPTPDLRSFPAFSGAVFFARALVDVEPGGHSGYDGEIVNAKVRLRRRDRECEGAISDARLEPEWAMDMTQSSGAYSYRHAAAPRYLGTRRGRDGAARKGSIMGTRRRRVNQLKNLII